ncbi:MAG: GDSL-type esterase/lipase family protein [Oscillospiraceae bacterium]
MNNKFSFKNFSKLPQKQKLACYVIAGCAVLFLIVVIASSVILFGGKKDDGNSMSQSASNSSSDMATDATYKKDGSILDLEKLKGTILEETGVKDTNYLKETVFVGDSNTERLMMYEQISMDNFVGKSGMGITTAASDACIYFNKDDKAYTIPQAIAKMKPRRIVMTFGTNDADGSTKPAEFIKTYKAVIASIQKAYPHCDIIVNTVPPVAKKRTYNNISMQTIDAFNIALADMAQELDLKLINTNEFLRGDDGFGKPQYYDAKDGIHLSESGAKAMTEYVSKHEFTSKDRRPDTKNIPTRRKAPVASSTISSSVVAVKSAIVSYNVKVADGKALGSLKGDGFEGLTTRTFTFDKENTSFTVTAVPAEGYDFVKWSDGNTSASRTDKDIKEKATFTAEFVKKADPIVLTLDQNNIIVEEGQSFSIKATVTGKAEAKNVAWNTDGVHVHTGDTYTAALAVGDHTVIASIDGAKDAVAVKIKVNKKVLPVSVTVTGNNVTTVGTPVTFTATVKNADAANVVWTVNGAEVGKGATYTHPASAKGSASIVASIGTATGSISLTINDVPAPPPTPPTPPASSDATVSPPTPTPPTPTP